jgi:hypothetical protein
VNLSFKYQDIEHIIVEKEDQIRQIIDTVKEIDSDKCSDHEKERLLTKITSFEKISNDY